MKIINLKPVMLFVIAEIASFFIPPEGIFGSAVLSIVVSIALQLVAAFAMHTLYKDLKLRFDVARNLIFVAIGIELISNIGLPFLLEGSLITKIFQSVMIMVSAFVSAGYILSFIISLNDFAKLMERDDLTEKLMGNAKFFAVSLIIASTLLATSNFFLDSESSLVGFLAIAAIVVLIVNLIVQIIILNRCYKLYKDLNGKTMTQVSQEEVVIQPIPEELAKNPQKYPTPPKEPVNKKSAIFYQLLFIVFVVGIGYYYFTSVGNPFDKNKVVDIANDYLQQAYPNTEYTTYSPAGYDSLNENYVVTAFAQENEGVGVNLDYFELYYDKDLNLVYDSYEFRVENKYNHFDDLAMQYRELIIMQLIDIGIDANPALFNSGLEGSDNTNLIIHQDLTPAPSNIPKENIIDIKNFDYENVDINEVAMQYGCIVVAKSVDEGQEADVKTMSEELLRIKQDLVKNDIPCYAIRLVLLKPNIDGLDMAVIDGIALEDIKEDTIEQTVSELIEIVE